MKITNINQAIKQFLFEKNFISQEELDSEGMSSLVTSAYTSYCLNILGLPNSHIPVNFEGLPEAIKSSVTVEEVEDDNDTYKEDKVELPPMVFAEVTASTATATPVIFEATVTTDTVKEQDGKVEDVAPSELDLDKDENKEGLSVDTFVKPTDAEKTIVTNELKVQEVQDTPGITSTAAEPPKPVARSTKTLFGKK